METLLTACPADLIPADDRQLIIRDLLLDLHDKVSEAVWHMEGGMSAAMGICIILWGRTLRNMLAHGCHGFYSDIMFIAIEVNG